jgi:hypothetical protein
MTASPAFARRIGAALRRGRPALACSLLSIVLVGASACSKPVDFKQALEVTDISGGWYDFGIVDGKNKLVPTMTFRIRKRADVTLRSIAINVHFKKIVSPDRKTEEEMDEVFLQSVEFSEGNQTPILTVRPEHGYTGDAPQTRAQMLEHSLFKDARTRIFAKQSSTTWVELSSFDIPRVLITK